VSREFDEDDVARSLARPLGEAAQGCLKSGDSAESGLDTASLPRSSLW